MSTISAAKFEQICDGVWNDRATILFRRGALSGEDALVQALYWRLRKVGDNPDESLNDHAPLLEKLIEQYRDEREIKGKDC
ncbi:MAG: hypothetical protein DMF68_03825 [Acidobacteria bacterium]|nr:MAG: hypothetical protein DMF68_03825 [Acidobacteriota bacterium]